MKTKRLPYLILLLFTGFIERFGYYGSRAILVLYMLDEQGLNASQKDAFYQYGIYTVMIGWAALPMGLLTDFVLKQRKAILIGGLLAATGYALFALTSFDQIIGIFLIVSIGTGLMRPNLMVLVGRLYEVTDDKRPLGFMLYYGAVNLGAFVSIVAVGMVAEQYGWANGFNLAAMMMLIGVLLFWVGSQHLPMIELGNQQLSDEEQRTNSSNQILDSPNQTSLTNKLVVFKNWVPLFILITFTVTLFWGCYSFMGIRLNSLINALSDQFSPSLLHSFSSYFIFPALVIIGCYLHFSQKIKSLGLIGLSFIILGLGISFLYFGFQNPENTGDHTFYIFLSITALIALAEVLLSSIVMSLITRVSPKKFSSTFTGLYLTLTAVGIKSIEGITSSLPEDQLILLFVPVAICLVIALFFFILQKNWLFLSTEETSSS